MITVTKIKLFDDTSNAVRAVADVAFDVRIADGTTGKIAVNGLRVIQGRNGKSLWVSFPAKHGQKSWFDIVAVTGPLHKATCDAVLLKYGEAVEERSRRRPT